MARKSRKRGAAERSVESPTSTQPPPPLPLDLVRIAATDALPARTRLRLRVSPGAAKNAVRGPHGGALKVSVTAPPEKSKANDAVIALLARALSRPKADFAIVAGHGSQDKTLEIAGHVTDDALRELL